MNNNSIFDLEQDLLKTWGIIDLLSEMLQKDFDSEDMKMNILLGLVQTLQVLKEEEFKKFEDVCQLVWTLKNSK